MQGLTAFAVTCAALGTAMAAVEALLPAGTVRATARTAVGVCYLAALTELAAALIRGGM